MHPSRLQSTATALFACAAFALLAVAALPAQAAARRPARPRITVLSATPTILPATGGTVRVIVTVRNARTCRFTSALRLRGVPATKRCSSRRASATVTIPATTATAGQTFRLSVKATGRGGTRTASTTVTQTGAQTGPAIAQQPAMQALSPGETATFTAAASGSPAPTVQWQVSSDNAATWTAILGATSTTYSFSASAAETGDEYRAVFTNAAGSATTNAASLFVGSSSSIWSGYAISATPGTFNTISGNWVVPTVTCPTSTSELAAQWIGIDGYGNDTVEQIGTDTDCDDGSPQYYAWYEMFGDMDHGSPAYDGDSEPLNYPVSPGDSMTAAVSVSGFIWTLNIADTTKGWTSMTNITAENPIPAAATAEWIIEAPTVCTGRGFDPCSVAPLSDFGTASFTNATANGQSAASFTPDALAIESNLSSTAAEAAPGPLIGSSFTDTWYSSN